MRAVADMILDWERIQRAAATAGELLGASSGGRWEVFVKGSCSRRSALVPSAPPSASRTEELGVAVRTFEDRQAGFGAASGMGEDAARRAVDGAARCRRAVPFDPLPPPRLLGTTSTRPPPAPAAPGWANHVGELLAATLIRRSDGLLAVRRTVVWEGVVGWLLITSEGFAARHEETVASLVAEIQAVDDSSGLWREWCHIPDPDGFDPDSVAGRIANRVLLSRHPLTADSGIRDLILDAEVAAQLLAGLAPLFLATHPRSDPLPRLVNDRGELAAPALTVLDDRTDPAAPITGPCDGEGLPAARTLLVDGGVPRHRLGSFRDATACSEVPRGGAVRPSYRDYPASGFANLVVAARDGVAPAALLAAADRALYLLRPLASPLVDLQHDTYRIIASGVWLRGQRVVGWHPVVELRGSLTVLLRRIDAVGTDVGWFQTDRGFVAAPSLLIRRQPVVG